ncbi:hypothetical protein ACFX15_046422 [Malus domestica]
MCRRKGKSKNLKVVERVCAGQLCVELEGAERCTTSSIYSTRYLLGRVKTLLGSGLLLLIKHQLDQSFFHYDFEPSPLSSRIHFPVINLAETPYCARIRLPVLQPDLTDLGLEAYELNDPWSPFRKAFRSENDSILGPN